MKNNLYCFCKNTLIDDQANSCSRQFILDKISALTTPRTQMSAIQSEYDSTISTLDSADDLLPEDFQNGLAYHYIILRYFKK